MNRRMIRYQPEQFSSSWKPIGKPCTSAKTARNRAKRKTRQQPRKTRIIRIIREIMDDHEVK